MTNIVQETKLAEFRNKFMLTRKVICTGNPDREFTIASGIRKIFPSATFLCKSNGWDLTDSSIEMTEKLKKQFSIHNTFINASYIGPGTQYNLLNLCNQSMKFGDIFNMGSTNEYDELGTIEYKNSKLALRELSLALNTFRFKTHHLILGHLRTSSEQDEYSIEIDKICQIIQWISNQDFEIPIMSIDQKKCPW